MTNFYFAVATLVISVVSSFAATWFLGFDENAKG